MGPEEFSVRWTGNFDLAAGSYIFSATADDGVRLYVDGQLVIDKWIDEGATTYTASVPLVAGTHEIKLEYYENWGDAVVRLSWIKQ
jgi:type IV pilus assembly protein PilY1